MQIICEYHLHAFNSMKTPGSTIQSKMYNTLFLGPDTVTNMEISEPVGKCALPGDTYITIESKQESWLVVFSRSKCK